MSRTRSDGAAIDAGLQARARRVVDANARLLAVLGGEPVPAQATNVLFFILAEDEGRGVSTSRCCAATSAPRTTALRWLKALATAGLVTQEEDPADRRVTLVRLTPEAAATLRDWLAAIAGG